MLNFPIFNFIILNLVKKGILDPSYYYSLWHIYMKAALVEHFEGKFWKQWKH